MKRTSQALRRFGVPVLAATALLAGGQIALGSSAFAAAGDLTITPADAYGSVTNTGGGADQLAYTITYSGPQAATATQHLTVTVSGSATILAGSGTNPVTPASGNKSATCTTTLAAQHCSFKVTDTVSENATISGTDQTDTAAGPATAHAHFASLYWTTPACTQSAPNDDTNCVTQTQQNTATTYTVTYKTDGSPAAGVGVTFTTSSPVVSASQPTGTSFFDTSQAQCNTNAQGQCSVTILDNTSGDFVDIDATTNNTGNYPSSFAELGVNVLSSTAPGRLVQDNQALIEPGAGGSGDNMPGDVVRNDYTLYNCTANSSSGKNTCLEDTPLSGVTLTVSLDHGFFTPACVSQDGLTESYANCTFNTTPAAGTKVGDLKSLGQSMTVTTDANGQFSVYEGIARDSAFDLNGNLTATLKATSGSATLTESQSGQSASTASCPGNPGCATGTDWTTDDAPLNGGDIKFSWITTPALSDSATNEIQNGGTHEVNIAVLHMTDQFGNLTSAGGSSADVTATGAGELFFCSTYTASDPCHTRGAVTFTQPNGTPTYSDTFEGSYNQAFDNLGNETQDRLGVDSAGAQTDGLQTLTASWDAPVTTFSAFVAGTSTTPAIASYNTDTKTVTDTVKNDFYTPVAKSVTFATTPSNHVGTGVVVTTSATVKDQHGQGIEGLSVQFIRSGPTTNSGTSCSMTNDLSHTNAAGQAGTSFTCTNASKQVVTIVVQDASGNELARGTQTITFGAVKTHISATIHCTSPRKHVLKCKVHVSPKISGLTVVFKRVTASGTHSIGVRITNANGVAKLVKKHLKSGKHWHVKAHVRATSRTTGANTGVSTATIK